MTLAIAIISLLSGVGVFLLGLFVRKKKAAPPPWMNDPGKMEAVREQREQKAEQVARAEHTEIRADFDRTKGLTRDQRVAAAFERDRLFPRRK